MLNTKLRIAEVVLVAVVILDGGMYTMIQPVLGEKPVKQKPMKGETDDTVANGIVKAVNAAMDTITVANKTGAKTFTVAPDAAIMMDGKPGKLAEVPIQAHVTLRLSDDKRTVRNVQVSGQQVPGIMKAVTASRNSITVINKLGERSYDVAPNALVHIDGTPGNLTDVPVGTHVTLSLSADQKTARSIQAEGLQVNVVVKAVDVVTNAITVADKRRERTFNIAKTTKVLLDDIKEGKLGDLIDGTVISARLSIANNEIIGVVRAAGPGFQGIIKGVDAENNTVTLTIRGKGADAQDKTFQMTKDTKIVTAIYGVALTAADLKGENKEVILRLSTDQKAAARITLLGQ